MKIKKVLDVRKFLGSQGPRDGWLVSLLVHFPPGRDVYTGRKIQKRDWRQIIVLRAEGTSPRNARFSVIDTFSCFGSKLTQYEGSADETKMVRIARKAIKKFLKETKSNPQ